MRRGILIIGAFLLVCLFCCLIYLYITRSGQNMEGFANTTPGNYDGLYDGALTIQTISNPTKDQINSILGQILNQLNEQTDKRKEISD